jgi:catechol 2,3-dioxygenase-like lactoylglutathione lyase family enzyme
VRFARVTLAATPRLLQRLEAFYGTTLGLPHRGLGDGFAVGETALAFVAGRGEPFYHLALLVPDDRWDAARAWVAERVELLRDPATGTDQFDFSGWEARAVYFHDPAGSIVELIAHAGIGAQGRGGEFSAAELGGVSEVGLVGDTAAMATSLRYRLGLELWDGAVGEETVGFVGEKARTFVLAPPGRGWLPTRRPAERHPLDVVLAGPVAGDALLAEGAYRVRSSAQR